MTEIDAPPTPEIKAQVQAWLQQPYRKTVRRDPDGGYVAEVAELQGCLGAGETEVEALESLHEAMAVWFQYHLEQGRAIPTPAETETETRYTGRVLVRMPKTLHRQLVTRAEREGVSLNQFAVVALAQAVQNGDLSVRPAS